MLGWIDDEAMSADHVVGAWNHKPSFADLASDPTQSRETLDETWLVIGIQGCDDHPVVAMSLFEILGVPHVRLTAVQYDTHDALVGIREIVSKRPIGHPTFIGGE